MKITITGGGTVGCALAERLSSEGHDIIVVDVNPAVLSSLPDTLDVMTVEGNSASLEVLKSAGVADADLMIATANADEINILSCIAAKKLGCPHTIARVRNPEYTQQLMFLKEELGLSLSVNPELAAAQEIYRLIQFPSFLKRDSFNKGRVELVEFALSAGSVLVGKKLSEVSAVIGPRALICAVERGEEVFIPKGSFELAADDKITVTAARKELAALIKRLELVKQKIHSVLIIGGSRIAEYLTEELLRSGVNVKIIDRDLGRCEFLSQKFPNALIIHGDAARRGFLESEGIAATDAVITLTGLDEENLIISKYATYVGVPKVITKMKRTEFSHLFENRDIGSLVCPKELTVNEITRYVRAMANSGPGSLRALHRIVDGKAEALEFTAQPAEYIGVPISQLHIKPEMLIACIWRRNSLIIPKGDDLIQVGDILIVVTSADRTVSELQDIFEKDPLI